MQIVGETKQHVVAGRRLDRVRDRRALIDGLLRHRLPQAHLLDDDDEDGDHDGLYCERRDEFGTKAESTRCHGRGEV